MHQAAAGYSTLAQTRAPPPPPPAGEAKLELWFVAVVLLGAVPVALAIVLLLTRWHVRAARRRWRVTHVAEVISPHLPSSTLALCPLASTPCLPSR